MKKDHQSLMSVTMVTVHMLLSVFFLPAVWAAGYCNGKPPAFRLTTPNTTEALNGSCLLIPCSFTAAATSVISKLTSGFWIKGDSYIYSSRNSVKSFPVNITGNLNQRDCTTVFSDLNTSDSGEYFFRIENSSFKATACADPLQITVRDSPWRPRITISGGLEDLKEKESVSITCSAWTPCPHSPPELTWNLQPDSDRLTEENPDGTVTTKIQENITLSDTYDGYNITCSVSYPLDGGERLTTTETVTLDVSYAPKDTSASISPSALVSAGSWVQLSCSSRAKPPVSSFSWFRISSEGPVKVSEEQLYSLQVTSKTDIDNYFCVAVNDLGVNLSQLKILKNGEQCQDLTPLITVICVSLIACLLVSVWYLKFRHQTSQKSQSQTDEVGNQREELYEEMNTIKRPQASTVLVQGRGQQDRGQQDRGQQDREQQDRGQQDRGQHTQVKVSKPADSLEDLYSTVEKK